MLIEKWILIEMLARLVELKKNGTLKQVEGEHKYPNLKSTRYEHCDLWWCEEQQEHWLEVKTIVPLRDRVGWKKEINEDLDKPVRLRSLDVFHHLAIAFPLTPLQVEPMLNDLDWLYSAKGFKPEANWKFPIGGGKTLLAALFKQVDRRANVVNFFKAEPDSSRPERPFPPDED